MDNHVARLVIDFLEKKIAHESFRHIIGKISHITMEYLPILENILLRLLDDIFLPRQIFKQFLIAFGIQIGLFSSKTISDGIQFFFR